MSSSPQHHNQFIFNVVQQLLIASCWFKTVNRVLKGRSLLKRGCWRWWWWCVDGLITRLNYAKMNIYCDNFSITLTIVDRVRNRVPAVSIKSILLLWGQWDMALLVKRLHLALENVRNGMRDIINDFDCWLRGSTAFLQFLKAFLLLSSRRLFSCLLQHTLI